MKKLWFFILALLVVGLAASFVYAENNGTSTTSTPPRVEKKISWQRLNATSTPATDLVCAQTAVATRETSIDTAYDTMTTAIKTALTARKADLNTAWGISVNKDRRVAIKAAWDKFNKTNKDARAAYKKTVKAAWKQFYADSRACHVPNITVEPMNQEINL